ncbi:MAG: hydantoinase/oxoprolinase family protein [bacterium]
MDREAIDIVGWDIGGVQVKAAWVIWGAGKLREVRTAVRPFEIWHDRELLCPVLGEVAEELGLRGAPAMAVTMTAELSDAFRSKREGVLFVLDSVRRSFPDTAVHALSAAGEFVPLESARRRPLGFAATNWVASALFTAERHPDSVLVDVGGTTTDIIPIRDGRILCDGRSDLDRLGSGELVYTGVLRTNPNTLTGTVPVRGRPCRVAAEHFAVMADVYLLLGRISPQSYTCATPDGRAKSPEAAAERLARLVCADDEMLSREEILKLAYFLSEKQLAHVSDGLLQVLSRLEGAYGMPLVPAGAGAFVAIEAGRRLGLEVLEPELPGGSLSSGVLPAVAAACLLARRLEAGRS